MAILNNGFRPGHPTIRCVGPKQEPTPFSNFAMVALAGIGRITDTIEDRGVNITIRRRLPGETVSKFRLRRDVPACHLDPRPSRRVGCLGDRRARGAGSQHPGDGLEDRAEDTWEPLIAHWQCRRRPLGRSGPIRRPESQSGGRRRG